MKFLLLPDSGILCRSGAVTDARAKIFKVDTTDAMTCALAPTSQRDVTLRIAVVISYMMNHSFTNATNKGCKLTARNIVATNKSRLILRDYTGIAKTLLCKI